MSRIGKVLGLILSFCGAVVWADPGFESALAKATLPACRNYAWWSGNHGGELEQNLVYWLNQYARFLINTFPEGTASLMRSTYFDEKNIELVKEETLVEEGTAAQCEVHPVSLQPRILVSKGLESSGFFWKTTLLHETIHVGHLFFPRCLPPGTVRGCGDLQAISELVAWVVDKRILSSVPYSVLTAELAKITRPEVREILAEKVKYLRSLDMKSYLLVRTETYARAGGAYTTEENVLRFLEAYISAEAQRTCPAPSVAMAYQTKASDRTVAAVEKNPPPEESPAISVPTPPDPPVPLAQTPPVPEPVVPRKTAPRTPPVKQTTVAQPEKNRNYATAGQRTYVPSTTGNALEQAIDDVVNASDPTKPPVRCVSQDISVRSEPLLLGAAQGNLRKIREALASGDKINQVKYNRTAISCAIENGRTKALEWLLDHGANPNLSVRRGLVPLAIASVEGSIAHGRNPEFARMVKALLKKGADPNRRTRNGIFARTYAYGDEAISKILIAHGAKANLSTGQ